MAFTISWWILLDGLLFALHRAHHDVLAAGAGLLSAAATKTRSPRRKADQGVSASLFESPQAGRARI
jgi:hypothetical protein